MRKIIMYSTTWCGDCIRSKAFLDKHKIPYKEIDIDNDQEAANFVQRANKGFRSVPTIIFPDGSTLVEPSNNELGEKLKQVGILHTES